MKTSIVAVVAASLFLVAAYMGLGGGPGTPPGPPQRIALAGPSSDAATPLVGDLPSASPSSTTGPSQVLAVGRRVQQGSLQDLATRAATPGGPVDIAAGPPATPGQQYNATVNADVVPVSGSGSGAAPPPSNVAKPGSGAGPVQIPTILPTKRPRPEPSATPIKPTPTPTATPAPVTTTVTPPVTSTVAPSTVSPTPPHP
jgi:hypothetical protein